MRGKIYNEICLYLNVFLDQKLVSYLMTIRAVESSQVVDKNKKYAYRF